MAAASFLSNLADWLRVCPHCHSIRKGRARWLCPACDRTLEESRVPEMIATYGCYSFPLITLYHWRAGRKEVVLGSWLRSLKGGFPKEQALRLAERLCYKAHRLGQLPPSRGEGACIVPAPLSAKRKLSGESNHALDLAQAVGEILKLPVWDGLERLGDADQKRLSVAERRGIDLRPRASVPTEVRAWLFIDDVVTTGATAIAAHRALKSPAKYAVWALSDRSRLPG